MPSTSNALAPLGLGSLKDFGAASVSCAKTDRGRGELATRLSQESTAGASGTASPKTRASIRLKKSLTGAPVGDGIPLALSLAPRSCASRLRTVTGSTGSASSMIPKRAENFASGGNSSVLTISGNREALGGGRRMSSVRPAGISIVYRDDSLNGPAKVRLRMSDRSDPSDIFAARRVPSGPMIAMRLALSADIGAENESDIGVTGMHAACGFLRSHPKRASNTERTLKFSS